MEKNNNETLYLNLKGCWYDMIESGEKKEEYREIKPFWTKRLKEGDSFKQFKQVCFVYGYTKRKMLIECKGIKVKTGNPKWGAVPDVEYYVIKLGNRID